jgi:hypothetical protein
MPGDRAELHLLAQALIDEPSLGLAVKTQFERNSPSRRSAGDPLIERARTTGRYIELRHRIHRHTLFPAEAALAADFAIGHIVGATAAVEAALAGGRCALLDSIRRFRPGDPAAATLGDWSDVLPRLDPWRDGRAAHRLRAELDDLFMAAPRPISVGVV